MDELQDKKPYEISFIGKTDQDAGAVLKLLKDGGAVIDSEEPVSKIALAYPVKKALEGYFGYFHFSLEPSKLVEVEKALRVHASLLRFLIVTPPFMKQKPRAFFPQRRRTAPAAPLAATERKSSSAQPLSNEALEQQLKEMQ